MYTETRKHNSLQAALLANTTQCSATSTPTTSANTEPRYMFGINTTQYQSKPTEVEVRKIKNQLVHDSKNYTLADLIDAVKHGCTICPAYIDESFEAHRAEYWKSQQIFLIDIDNADKHHNRLTDDKYISISKAQELLTDNDIHAFYIYKSFHHKDASATEPEFAKYRICIRLNELITDSSERERIIKALLSLFGEAADANCKNADRIFFGSTSDCSILEDTTAVTNKATVLKLYDNIITAKAENYNSVGYTDTMDDNILTTHKKNKYNFDINVLLYSINPDCSYDEWFEATIAYKGAGGTKEKWMAWSAQSLLWNEEADAAKWDSIKGTSRAHLIKLAGKTVEGRTYMQELKDAQAQAKAKNKKDAPTEPPSEEDLLFAEIMKTLPSDAIGDDDYVDSNTADRVEIKAYEYVYKPYIPKQVYTVLYGDGGVSKTTLCCGIAAAISAGIPLPGDDTEHTPKKVLYISAEDTESTIAKRLLNMGAILSNISICDCDRSHRLACTGDGLRRLKKLIQRIQPELIFIDPWHAFVAQQAKHKINLNRMEQLRPMLQSIALLSRLFNCGIVLVAHSNKTAQETNANNAASGSADFINASRSAIRIIEDTDPNNPMSDDCRLAVHTKSNYHKLGKTLSYAIVGDHVEWLGFSDVTKRSLEVAVQKKITPQEAILQINSDKTDFTALVDAITGLCNMTTDPTCTLLYEELEAYSPQGKDIWNKRADNQKANVIKGLKSVLKLEHHLQIEIGSKTSKTCFDGIHRNGRGIIVTKLYSTSKQ